jgi:hypothetical protein
MLFGSSSRRCDTLSLFDFQRYKRAIPGSMIKYEQKRSHTVSTAGDLWLVVGHRNARQVSLSSRPVLSLRR